MTTKQGLRIAVDFLMSAMLLLLMVYERIGTLPHEVLGTGMFVLLILHHILNRSWLRNLFKGKYSLYRVIQTAFVLLIFLTMIGSMASGVVLSRHLFAALPIRDGRFIARTAHMLCGYWGFVLMSLHLDLHWNVMIGVVRRMRGGEQASPSAVLGLRLAAVLVALYGLQSFFGHDLGDYLLLRTHFVVLEFDRPVALLLLDYLAIMGLFVICGYYAGRLFHRKNHGSKP